MVFDLQKKMHVLKQKNEQLQNCPGSGYCSLPHSHGSSQCSAHYTGSLPHALQTRKTPLQSINNTNLPLASNGAHFTFKNGLNTSAAHTANNNNSLVSGIKVDPVELSSQVSSQIVSMDSRQRNGVKQPNVQLLTTDPVNCEKLKNSSSVPELLLVLHRVASAPGKDEGYCTMGSNVQVSDSRSTLPRATRATTASKLICPTSSSKFTESVPRTVYNASDISKSSANNSCNRNNLVNNNSNNINLKADLLVSSAVTTSSPASATFSSSNRWSTVPRFNSSCANKASMQPSKTHQSISLSKSKYLSPMACEGLVQIISDMMKAVYVTAQADANADYHNPNKYPVKLRFMSNSSDKTDSCRSQGVYDLHFEACNNTQCSVCRDIIERGSSTFEVLWPCPEGRKLQLIHMSRRTPSFASTELVCSNEVSTYSQETTQSFVTQISNNSDWPDARSKDSYTDASCRNSGDLSCFSNHQMRADSVTSGSVLPLSSDSEFVQPELEWCGGDFQQPDNDWPQVHELMIPSASPRSGSCDQLAQYPNDLSCNGSLNSVYVGNLDRLGYSSSSILYNVQTSSCPDISSISEIFDEPLSESASEGDLMGLLDADDRSIDQGEHRKFYSLFCAEDEDMFSPTAQQFGEPVMPSLLSMFQPKVASSASSHDSCVQPSSPLPPQPALEAADPYLPDEEFPEPPFPEPPDAELMEGVYNIPEQGVQDYCKSAAPPVPPAPNIPPHFGAANSPSIPKRITSRPLPCLPAKPDIAAISSNQQQLIQPQLADYTISEHVQSPNSPPPVLPIRRLLSTSSTNSNFKLNNSHRTLPQSCSHYGSSSHYTMSSLSSHQHQPPPNGITSALIHPEDQLGMLPTPLPHIMPRPPPRAPRRSTSLLSNSRPVSSVTEFPFQQEDSEGGVYGSLSNGSSPLEGLESSWVRLNSDAVTTVCIIRNTRII